MKPISISERQEFILKKIKEREILVSGGIPNKKYGSKENNKLNMKKIFICLINTLLATITFRIFLKSFSPLNRNFFNKNV